MRWIVALVGALSLCVAGCDYGDDKESASVPKPCPELRDTDQASSAKGSVALVLSRRQGSELFVVDMPSGKARRLTRQRTPHDHAADAAWSRNGLRLAYSGGTSGWDDGAHDDIWVIPSRGGKARRLTSSREDDWHPTWSPDGKMIAFDRQDDGYNWIFVVNADGTGLRRLTAVGNWNPAWTPDGRISYVNYTGIWVVNPEGTGRRLLAPAKIPINGYANVAPAWSPDGTHVAFTTDTALWVMNADGSGRHKIFGLGRGSTRTPRWSPDGTRIAWTQSDGDREIYIVNRDGSGLRNVTDNERVADEGPSWSRNGRAIAFTWTCLQVARDRRRPVAAMTSVSSADARRISQRQLDRYSTSGPVWSP